MPGMFAMSSLGASVVDIATSLVDSGAGPGVTQAKPLPTRVRLASSKATKTAVIRRARRMSIEYKVCQVRGRFPQVDPYDPGGPNRYGAESQDWAPAALQRLTGPPRIRTARSCHG